MSILNKSDVLDVKKFYTDILIIAVQSTHSAIIKTMQVKIYLNKIPTSLLVV